MDKILLFIPMYNCEKQIKRVLEQLTYDLCKYLSEVIIVNNRSTDNGEQVVKDFLNTQAPPVNVQLLRNDENYGLGGSHKIAFDYAKKNGFDYVIVLHGDDQGNVRDILKYLVSGDYKKYDSLLGSRFERNSTLINYSGFRIFGNYVFNLLVSIIAGCRLTDLGSGLNMYRVAYLNNEFYRGFPNSLTFNVYMLLYGVYSKSKFAFFPLMWREEDQVSNAKFFKQSMEILKLCVQYLADKRKLFDNGDNEYVIMAYTYQIIINYTRGKK